jgi:hypothetical protein
LDFYSDRTITPASVSELQYYWHYNGQPYFLLHVSVYKNLQLDSMKVIGEAEGWQLVTKDTNRL